MHTHPHLPHCASVCHQTNCAKCRVKDLGERPGYRLRAMYLTYGAFMYCTGRQPVGRTTVRWFFSLT